MQTSRLVRQTDRAEGCLRQLEIDIYTLQVLGTVFLEEAPHNIFGPFGRDQPIGNPIDSGMGLSITIDKLRVFINKTLSTQSLINQLLIKRVGLSIVIDNGKIRQGMRSCKCTNHDLYAGGCQ